MTWADKTSGRIESQLNPPSSAAGCERRSAQGILSGLCIVRPVHDSLALGCGFAGKAREDDGDHEVAQNTHANTHEGIDKTQKRLVARIRT
jgi:hypothetical protein